MSNIRTAGIVRESIVDGPGIRFVVFTQGCPHHCPGCHNPQTHNFDGGSDQSSEMLLSWIDENPLLSGVTFSGGEPFAQADALAELAHGVKERGLHLMVYSGYTYEELLLLSHEQPGASELLHQADVLMDGPFVEVQKDLTLAFRGSSNQRMIDVPASLATGSVVLVEE